MSDPNKLRELAAWYREFAERAGSPWVWEARLRTAEDIEAEAHRIEPGKTGNYRFLPEPLCGWRYGSGPQSDPAMA